MIQKRNKLTEGGSIKLLDLLTRVKTSIRVNHINDNEEKFNHEIKEIKLKTSSKLTSH